MNRDEIQHKLEQAVKDVSKLQVEVEVLEIQLAKAKKPKLRHGDFGYDKDGGPKTVLLEHSGNLLQGGVSYATTREGDPNRTLPLDCVLGNIFDLLEEWGEDLEEREVAGIRISVRSNCIFVGVYRLSTPEKQELFWKTIAQEYFTLKRKENKCS